MYYLSAPDKSAYVCQAGELHELLYWYDSVIAELAPQDATRVSGIIEHNMAHAPGGEPYLLSSYRLRLPDLEILDMPPPGSTAADEAGILWTGALPPSPGRETNVYEIAVADTSTARQENWALQPPRHDTDPYRIALSVPAINDPARQNMYYYLADTNPDQVLATMGVLPDDILDGVLQCPPLASDLMAIALPDQTRFLARAMGIEPPSFWRGQGGA